MVDCLGHIFRRHYIHVGTGVHLVSYPTGERKAIPVRGRGGCSVVRLFFEIPFYLQSVLVHSPNYVKDVYSDM
jgi:hypothetical protein